MKKLLAFAQFVQKKPTDTTIRIIRVILPALTCIALGISSDATSYTFGYFFASYEPIMEQVIAGIFLIPAIVFGGFWICGFKKNTMKKLQIIGALILWFLAITLEFKTQTSPLIPLWALELWLTLYGLYGFIGGISGKIITERCYHYKEIIKKIRV